MLCVRNDSLKMKLPLLLKFTNTRHHNSRNFLYVINNFGRNGCDPTSKNICLNSAHDNIPTYQLLQHQTINTLIDLNGRVKSSKNSSSNITFDKTGHSLCPARHKMFPWRMIPCCLQIPLSPQMRTDQFLSPMHKHTPRQL